MNKNQVMPKTIYAVIFILFQTFSFSQNPNFITVQGHSFFVNNHSYKYVGANYWFGGLLGVNKRGKKRLRKELDFLVAHGVNNLRVLAVAEGEGPILTLPRVAPAYQTKKEVYNDALLKGLDFLLVQMGKRNMKAVIYLGNNWEWSGGFLQYLNWNGIIADSVLQRKISWDENRDYVSRFYSCPPCIEQQAVAAQKIITRVNTISKKKYAEDTAIMSWELANEPRPMRPAAIGEYKSWIANTAATIKSLDKNHLITTGCEGDIGTEGMEVYSAIHADKNIDYATIHIWPKNWAWFSDTSMAKSLPVIIKNTTDFIDRHITVMDSLNKPLVLEEFGLPRDEQSFLETSSTYSRDYYYTHMFSRVLQSIEQNGVINGLNFWAFAGRGRPSHRQLLWKQGEDLLGDPPVEEQGLNSVFDSDTSTWNIIKSFAEKINKISGQQ